VSAIRAALDKLERCYADMGLRVSEQETVPLARAELARVEKALEAADTMAAQLEATNGALGIGLPSSVAAYRAVRKANS
jgi:hypothetical protein